MNSSHDSIFEKKRKIVERLRSDLASDLKEMEVASASANESENSELKRVRALVDLLRFFPLMNQESESQVPPGALVEVETMSTSPSAVQRPRFWALLLPFPSGWVFRDDDGDAIQVLSLRSPLGEQLVGREKNQLISVVLQSGSEKKYRVLRWV